LEKLATKLLPGASKALQTATGNIALLQQALFDITGTYEDYISQLERAGAAQGALSRESYEGQKNAVELQAQWDASDAVLAQMTADMIVHTETTLTNTNAVAAAYDSAAYLVTQNARLSQSYQNLAQVQNSLKAVQDELATATVNLQQAEQNWLNNTANDVVASLQAMKIEGSGYKDALSAIDEVYGTDLLVQQQYKDDVAALVAEYKKTGDLETFKTKLGELKDVYMPLDDQVQENLESVQDLKTAIDALESKEIWIYQHIVTLTDPEPVLPAGGSAAPGADYAGGGAGEGGPHDPDQEFAPGSMLLSAAATPIYVYVTLPTDDVTMVENAARTGVLSAMRAIGKA